MEQADQDVRTEAFALKALAQRVKGLFYRGFVIGGRGAEYKKTSELNSGLRVVGLGTTSLGGLLGFWVSACRL